MIIGQVSDFLDFKVSPTNNEAFSVYLRSGFLFLSIGVGTVTIKTSASFNSSSLFV